MTQTSQAEAPQKNRKIQIGEVVSAKMQKTVIVQITRRVRHPQFKKIITKRERFHVHDGEAKAKVGDRVRIGETRPLSRLKRWELLEVITQAEETVK